METWRVKGHFPSKSLDSKLHSSFQQLLARTEKEDHHVDWKKRERWSQCCMVLCRIKLLRWTSQYFVASYDMTMRWLWVEVERGKVSCRSFWDLSVNESLVNAAGPYMLRWWSMRSNERLLSGHPNAQIILFVICICQWASCMESMAMTLVGHISISRVLWSGAGAQSLRPRSSAIDWHAGEIMWAFTKGTWATHLSNSICHGCQQREHGQSKCWGHQVELYLTRNVNLIANW